jgi:glucan-binding YG repeat protein
MAIGWENISDQRYYFDDDGLMHTGWLDAEDGKYHFSDTGVMDTGKTDLMTNYRQQNPDTKVWEDKTGLMTYIFDQDGRMLADRFVSADGKTYHIDRYGWVEKDRWVEVDNDKYHARKDGSLDKGMTDFVYEGNTYTYFFDDEGKMQTGFVDTKGNTYYLNEYGVMEKGRWVKVDSDLYHAQKSGALDKGLTDIANGSRIYTYYFDEKGKMQTGFVEADGERYHMDENGVMEKNVWVKDGKDRYHMGADGTADTGWQTIDRENYYFDTDGSLYDRTPGDINDDNRVDGRDAIRLMKWLAGDEVEEDTPFCANGDVDHDKEVDEHDLLRMMKYFGGEKVDLE